MGLFKKRTKDPAEIQRLKDEVASMAKRLDASDEAKHELGSTVDGLVTRLNTPIAPPPTEPPPIVDPEEFNRLRARVLRLAERIDAADQRITAISTELANQITELSGDIEGINAAGPPTDEIVGELRDAQTRLAAEQARYQIAFRQDMASLADRLRDL